MCDQERRVEVPLPRPSPALPDASAPTPEAHSITKAHRPLVGPPSHIGQLHYLPAPLGTGGLSSGEVGTCQ